MAARFDTLPYELKRQIFEFSIADIRTRLVEVYMKEGKIYSKTPPPPLLQVCSISRDVTLRKYKPWLPQFRMEHAGNTKTNVHEPYKVLVEERGVETLSRLNNVCISLEKDVLLIDKQQWSKWDFGYLERHELRQISLNLEGWLHWSASVQLLEQFGGLKNARIFDRNGDIRLHEFKVGQIESRLVRAEKHSAKKGLSYVAPSIKARHSGQSFEWGGSRDEWYKYKFPKTNAQSERSEVENRFTGIFGSQRPEISGLSRWIGTELELETSSTSVVSNRISLPARFNGAYNSRITTKRRSDDAANSYTQTRKAAKLSHNGRTGRSVNPSVQRLTAAEIEQCFLHPEIAGVEQDETDMPSPTAEEAFAKIFEFDEFLRNSTPDPEVSEKPQPRVTREGTAEEYFSKIFDCDFMDYVRSSSLEMANMENLIPDPLHLIDAFSSLVKGSHRSMIVDDADPLDDNTVALAAFVDPRSAFYDPFDTPVAPEDLAAKDQTESMGLRDLEFHDSGFHDTIEQSTVEAGQDIGADHDEADLSRPLRADNADEIIAAQAIAVLRSIAPDTEADPCTDSVQTNNAASTELMTPAVTMEIEAAPTPVPDSDTSTTQSVPERIVAERRVSRKLQYLVLFSDQSTESWLDSRSLLKTSPEVIKEWKSRKTEDKTDAIEQPVLEDVVEKILGKRKFKGVPHYLVKWEGYPLEKDRTWEPCERLKIDVPTLVEEYEAKLSKKGKGKKK